MAEDIKELQKVLYLNKKWFYKKRISVIILLVNSYY